MKKRSFCKSFVKVKLVLVNIRFRLDISMPVMVTNLGNRVWGVTIVIPPSIKAIMGITTSPVCLASTHSPWAAYLTPTVEGILYLERKFLIPDRKSVV